MSDSGSLAEGGDRPLAPEAVWRVRAVSAAAFAVAALVYAVVFETALRTRLSLPDLGAAVGFTLAGAVVGGVAGARLVRAQDSWGAAAWGAAVTVGAGVAFALGFTVPSALVHGEGMPDLVLGLFVICMGAVFAMPGVPFGALAGWLIWRWRQRPLARTGAE